MHSVISRIAVSRRATGTLCETECPGGDLTNYAPQFDPGQMTYVYGQKYGATVFLRYKLVAIFNTYWLESFLYLFSVVLDRRQN